MNTVSFSRFLACFYGVIIVATFFQIHSPIFAGQRPLAIENLQPHLGERKLDSVDVEALMVIAGRKGVSRLSYDKKSKTWSYFDSGYLTQFKRFLQAKDRFDIMAPLEDLVARVEDGYWASTLEKSETFHLIRRSYSSLSSLYSFYKINPSGKPEKQAEFILRFSQVLVRFRNVLTNLESRLHTAKLYRPMPWFGEVGEDLSEDDKRLGLHYVEMGVKGLAEINIALQSIGNENTRIDGAMEFYPREKSGLERAKEVFSPQNKSLLADQKKKFAIFILHGTWAAGSKEYSDESNLMFQQTKYMAQAMANQLGWSVELYSFGWSGLNDNESRMIAGEELANFVRTYFPSGEYNDVYVGHSHGGNVILHCAKTLREYQTPFMIVTLATPIRKDFITDNLNFLFQFYTNSDWVQFFGSYEITRRAKTENHIQDYRKFTREDIRNLGLFSHNDRYHKTKIYSANVSVAGLPISGALQSHFEMKHLISILPIVLDQIFAYPAHSHFDLDLSANLTVGKSVRQLEQAEFNLKAAGSH